VVCQCNEVVGRSSLDLLSIRRKRDLVASSENEGVFALLARACGKGIGGVLGVQMLLAEIDVPERIRLARFTTGLARGIGYRTFDPAEASAPRP
jgi:hypothetical protein